MFEEEESVFRLLRNCTQEGEEYFNTLSSPSVNNKKVQIRPWKCCEARWVVDQDIHADPRLAVFVGGAPRTITAQSLGTQVDNIFGGVQLCEIDTDRDTRYPKGAAKVTFNNTGCFTAAVVGRFINIKQDGAEKRVEMKPFVLENQACDICSSVNGALYCPYVGCFKYFCQGCWGTYHHEGNMPNHKPLVKEVDRTPRAAPTDMYSSF